MFYSWLANGPAGKYRLAYSGHSLRTLTYQTVATHALDTYLTALLQYRHHLAYVDNI